MLVHIIILVVFTLEVKQKQANKIISSKISNRFPLPKCIQDLRKLVIGAAKNEP